MKQYLLSQPVPKVGQKRKAQDDLETVLAEPVIEEPVVGKRGRGRPRLTAVEDRKQPKLFVITSILSVINAIFNFFIFLDFVCDNKTFLCNI